MPAIWILEFRASNGPSTPVNAGLNTLKLLLEKIILDCWPLKFKGRSEIVKTQITFLNKIVLIFRYFIMANEKNKNIKTKNTKKIVHTYSIKHSKDLNLSALVRI